MNETRLQEARRLYELATHEWRHQRQDGGIVEETDERERSLGVRFKGATPAGKIALGMWQKRKAELDAAAEYAQFEKQAPALPASRPDRRLPPERDPADDDAADFAAEF